MNLDRSRPFTRAEALAAGITVSELAGPKFQRIFHGIYLPSTVRVEILDRARAALKVGGEGSYVSHHTAAALWGGWPPATSDTHICVPGDTTRSVRRGIFAHRADPGVTPVKRRGIWLSPATQVFIQLAASRADLVDLVVLGDSLARAQHVTPQELIELADDWQGSGALLARRAARLVREGVDSPTESRLRMLIVLAGLPEPQVNVVVRHRDGEWRRRFDLCYPELKLIIEYDGRQHAEDSRQWNADIHRREELERQGWRLIIVTADALYVDPSTTLRRIWDALEDRGCQRLPARIAAPWSRHFRPRAQAA